MDKVLYIIGSLRNERVQAIAKAVRELCPDVEVFDDWYAAGPEADDFWKSYEQHRGRSYREGLGGYAAKHVFEFDKFHLDRSTHVLLVLPAGKSGHMEVMYGKYGVGAKAAILLDPEDVRWDVMYQFVDEVFDSNEEIVEWLNGEQHTGQTGTERQLSAGDGTSGLLSQCTSRSGEIVMVSDPAAPPGFPYALGPREIVPAPRQDTSASSGRRWFRRQGTEALNDGGVACACQSAGRARKGRGTTPVKG